MNIANAQSVTSATGGSTPVSTEKAPENIAKSSAKDAVVKRTLAKRKVPIASVERATTHRRRASVDAGKAISTKQSSARKPVIKKAPVVIASARTQAVLSSKPPVVSDVSAPKKVSKGKVIRDSVTMPIEDYERLGALKKKSLTLGIAIKKSELLRAGLITLQRLTNEDLTRVLALVEKIKTGRPAGKEKKSKSGKKIRK